MPPQPWIGKAGVFIGAVSTLVGIGGGSLNVPFMSLCRVPIHRAIGTAAALGIVIAVPASIGFAVIGWDAQACRPIHWAISACRLWH